MKIKQMIIFMGVLGMMLASTLVSCGNAHNTSDATHKTEYADDDKRNIEIIDSNEELNGTFKWYRYKENGKVGALDENKDILIPAEYDAIGFDEKSNTFKVFLKDNENKYWGNFNQYGKTIIDVNRHYSFINLVELTDGRSYYEVAKGNDDCRRHGICNADGSEIIEPLYGYISYNTKFHEYRYRDEEIEYSDFESFYTLGDEGCYIMYYFINDLNEIKRMPSPIFDKIYSRENIISKNNTYNDNLSHITQVRCYKDKMLFNFKECPFQRVSNGKRIYAYVFSEEGEEGEVYDLYEQNGKVIKENENYKVSYCDGRDFCLADYRKKIENNNSTSTYGAGVESNDYYNGYGTPLNSSSSETPSSRIPIRNPCRACGNTGDCVPCGGRGETKTHLTTGYNEGLKLVPEQCRNCGGSGRCPACGGDGWLDEGIDF